MKNKFIKALLSPTSDISSKRFSGLMLLGLFGITTLASIFLNINENAQALVTTEGILGAALLGVNVFEKLTPVKK